VNPFADIVRGGPGLGADPDLVAEQVAAGTFENDGIASDQNSREPLLKFGISIQNFRA
jgi:hypothetical protein